MISEIFAGAQAITGIIGGNAENNRAKAAARAQDRFNLQQWEFDKRQIKRDNKYRSQGVDIARKNLNEEINWAETTAANRYRDELAILNYDYNNQVRQFNESEQLYGQQLTFNNQAAALAQAAQNRQYQEILTGAAFDQQDMFVKMLQEEGQLQARGVSGKSSEKALGAALAGFGRNQAIMTESLMSAKKEYRNSSSEIANQKYGADLNARSRRMLTPLRGPDPTAPLKLPRAVIQDAYKNKVGPKPIASAQYAGRSGTAMAMDAVGSLGSAGLGIYMASQKIK